MKLKEEDKSIHLTQQQLALVEKMGIFVENSGIQPAAARISALLMISDKVELTFDEIRETLGLSKSATSNALNLLLKLGRIEYITKTGDRKRYFRSDVSDWKNNVSEKFEEMFKMQEMLKEVLQQRSKKTCEFNKNLSEFISLLDYIFKRIPQLFCEWEKEYKNK